MSAYLFHQTTKTHSHTRKSRIMNTLRTLSFALLTFSFAVTLSAQTSKSVNGLEFKLQLMADNTTWGVFVRPDNSISPSGNTMTGSGQVTLVAPEDFTYTNFKNHGGMWEENARVDDPIEAPGMSYISFGFVTDEPRIKLLPNKETLLFTFTSNTASFGQIALIDNENDPFAAPNSYNSNPGNDLGVIDLSNSNGLVYYMYARNYENPVLDTNKRMEILASKND